MARKSNRKQVVAAEPELDGELITIPTDDDADSDEGVEINAVTGAVQITHEDGSMTIDPTGSTLWQQDDDEDGSHEENLALKIDPTELNRIANDELEGIEADKQDRSQWEQIRAKCLELVGLKLEDPKGDVSRSAMGMATSVVRDPTLLQAVKFFQANAFGELCPSAGPVKVKIATGDEGEATQDLAQALQDDLNYYLTTTASEYYPDMYYMLWWTGLTSGTFKKVYMCPLRQRPVSEFVDGTKLIVPSNATDLKNATRVTHEVEMDRSTMRAMQLASVYVEELLMDPLQPQINAVDAKRATIDGKAAIPQRIEDQKYTLYECYCKLDIKGFEHKKDGKPTGLPLPYRITIDYTSRKILEIRRNWDEEDSDKIYLPPQIPFVLFPFSTGLSRIYGSGLGHEMGNMASALTALLRISIDNGMLGNYPGLIKAKGPGRDLNNEIMVPPGGVVEIDTGGIPIQQFIMGVPFKDVSPNVMGLIEQSRGAAKELGGTANLPVAEGKQDAPVGTTLAMIEQATKPLSAIHKMLHSAQSEEFRLLVRLFRKDPESLWRDNQRPCLGAANEREAKFKAALDSCDIEPVADPNVPSEMHRKLIAVGLQQLTMNNPLFNQVEVARYITHTIFKMPNADFKKLLAPQSGQPDPMQMALQADLAIKKQNADTNQMKVALQHKQAEAALQSKEQIEATKLAVSHAQKGGDAKGPMQPDPAQAARDAAEIDLKHRKLDLDQTALAFKAHDSQANRDSKEAVEAFKFATTGGVHPEAAGVMDQQLAKVATFLEPAAQKRVAAGGPVNSELWQGEEDDEKENMARVKAIIEALQAPPAGQA